jgi:hypothetical protein
LSCSGFKAGETVDIYWANTTHAPLKNVKATSGGAVTASVVVPNSDIGNHYVIAKGRSSHKQAAALFITTPSIALSPSRGPVGTSVQMTLRGFSSGEKIEVTYQPGSGRATVVTTVTATTYGSASVTFAIPRSVYGSRTVKAVGQSSEASASANFSVDPTLTLVPSSATTGAQIGISLRGFGAREKVAITLAADGRLLATVSTDTTGSTVASGATMTVPASLGRGFHQIVATGATTGATDRANLRVTPAVTVAEEPPPTPASTRTATPRARPTAAPTATPSPLPTVAPSPTPEATATTEATATPESTAEPVDAENDEAAVTASAQPDPSPTATETPEPAPEDAATPEGG